MRNPFAAQRDFSSVTISKKMILGEDYASRYDTAEIAAAIKGYGLQAVVNLDGEYGEYYDRMLRKTEGFVE